MSDSRHIHDMIQTFDMGGHPELVASRLLDILDAMNRRMDSIESAAAAQTGDVLRATLTIREDLNKLLDLLGGYGRRMDRIESVARRANDTASCLANGIKPD